MKEPQAKLDFYELRPLLFVLMGMIGLANSFIVSASSPWLSHLGQACGLVLFFSAAKIVQWRKAYRQKWL